MKRNAVLVCVIFMGLALGLQLFVKDGLSVSIRNDAYGGSSHQDFVPGELLIKFRAGTSDQDMRNLSAENGLSVIQDISELGIKRVAIPQGLEEEMSRRLSSNPLVVYAEPNGIVTGTTIPNDTNYGLQWNMGKINATQAWDITTGSSNITIAIVDSGVDYSHLDLNDPQKLLPGWDYVNNDNNAQDDFGHGTHVAGIAAASTNNGRGVAGVAWGSKILPVKVLDNTNHGTNANVALGIRYAVDHGAKVINLSLGSSTDSTSVRDQINFAYSQNVVVVASAGNDGTSAYSYPASNDHVISVAATDSNDAHPSFSQYNDKVAVAAPGVAASGAGIYSTYWSNAYAYMYGTSMAAPHVSGLAALLLSQNSSLTPDQIKYQLEANAEHKGTLKFDPQYGFGRINAYFALRTHINYLMPWYDEQSVGMQNWVMTANPSTNTSGLNYSITTGANVASNLKGTNYAIPGLSRGLDFSGTQNGPVKVSSSDGVTKALFSQRILYNNNFNETMSVPESKLETDYYFPWYDSNHLPAPYFNTWIMVCNKGNQTANVEVSIHGAAPVTYQVQPDQVYPVVYNNVQDGPVRVRSTNNQKLLVSERTVYQGGVNELMGIPATSLSTENIFTWYDLRAQDGFSGDWVMITNMGSSQAHVEVYIGDMNNAVASYNIDPGSHITPSYANVMGGPVKVKCTNGQNILTSQRTLYGGHFEEVSGVTAAALSSSTWFTWYDTINMNSYIMLSNLDPSLTSTVDIYKYGVKMNQNGVIPVGPGTSSGNFFASELTGPIEVRVVLGPNVLVSQRVTNSTSFNELVGTVLSS